MRIVKKDKDLWRHVVVVNGVLMTVDQFRKMKGEVSHKKHKSSKPLKEDKNEAA